MTIGDSHGEPIAEDFVGLSYESAQLANPEFFSAKNKQLVRLFRELAPHGNLRIGGGSSEFTTYSDETPSEPPPFEVLGPDTSKTVKHGTVTSAVALQNLRSFLDATNWTCLYGLNLGQGTIENAVREGGGNGYYTPIAGAPSTGLIRRPEFFGIRFAQRFVGARAVDASLQGASPLVDVFIFEKTGKGELVLINKTPQSFRCSLSVGVTASAVLRLHAPTIDAKAGVQISSMREAAGSVAIAPSYTATVYGLVDRNS